MRDAAAAMVARRIHRVYVVDGERVTGVVSTRDLMDAIANVRSDVPISELATVPVHTVDVATPVGDAIARLGEGKGYAIRYELCTGCRACFLQCPCHAMEMVKTETVA